MRRIKQLDDTGCGLACVAMITGKTYNQIKQKAIQTNSLAQKGEYFTKPKHLRSLLKEFGISTGNAHAHKHWESLPSLAIIGINFNSYSWHWVVYNQGKIIDPKYLKNMNCPIEDLHLYNCIPVLT